MRRNIAKGLLILSIILIFSSPIISSMANTTFSVKNSTMESKTILIQNNLDPDIEAAIQMVNESLLEEYLTVLSVEIGPRMTGTYGAALAAKYLYEQFENMGLDVSYHHWEVINDRKPLRKYKDKNVVATLEGIDDSCDEILVFNAHYDTVKVSPGAIDDGSGVVSVLTAAHVLSQFKFNRTIKFVCFSGEEVGLLGSKAYAKELYENDTEILVELNADMVGYAVTADEGRNMTISSTEDAKWMVQEIKDVNENYGINFNIRSGWTINAGGMRHGSDYFDFVLYGYEAIAFWQSGNYGEYYHTAEDTIEKVNFSYLANMTRLAVATLAHLAEIDVYYPDVKIGAPRRGRLYFEDRTLKKFKYERTWVIDDFLIHADIKPGNSPIKYVEFYYDGKKVHNDTDPPYQWRLNKFSIRKHTVEVILEDELGRKARDQVTFRFINLFKKR